MKVINDYSRLSAIQNGDFMKMCGFCVCKQRNMKNRLDKHPKQSYDLGVRKQYLKWEWNPVISAPDAVSNGHRK